MAAKANRKEYGDDSRSRVDEMFASTDDVVRRNVCLDVYGERITFDQLQAAMIDRPPFVSTRPVAARVDLNDITSRDVARIRDSLETSVPRVEEPCVFQYACVKRFKEVNFYGSEMKNGKLYPPRMCVDVGTVEPNSSVRVNTGYVFKIPSRVDMQNVVTADDGVTRIEKTGYTKQPPFVIVPYVVCEQENSDGFVPTIYARDPEDTGLFTINFTTRTGVVGRLRVVFKAYRVVSPLNLVSVIDAEQSSTGVTVFKPKDQNPGRLVNNPKPKIVYESMRRCGGGADAKKVVFDTYAAAAQETRKVFEKQRLCVDRLTTLVVSRKREWDNGRLVSLAGLFVPPPPSGRGEGVCVAPKVAAGSEYNTNTHCVAFVNGRLNLFSERVTDLSDVKVVNGAFCDTDSYVEVARAVRRVIAALNGLSAGVAHCKNIAARRPDLPLDRLVRLMDYHKSVHESDDRLLDKCMKSDKGMYDSRPAQSEAYSVQLYRAFRTLVAVYFASRFTAAQIEALRLAKKDAAAAEPPQTAGGDHVYSSSGNSGSGGGRETDCGGDVAPPVEVTTTTWSTTSSPVEATGKRKRDDDEEVDAEAAEPDGDGPATTTAAAATNDGDAGAKKMKTTE